VIELLPELPGATNQKKRGLEPPGIQVKSEVLYNNKEPKSKNMGIYKIQTSQIFIVLLVVT